MQAGRICIFDAHIRCTGILVECGFSNREEEAALRTPEYQKKLCCVIASAADQFLTQEEIWYNGHILKMILWGGIIRREYAGTFKAAPASEHGNKE